MHANAYVHVKAYLYLLKHIKDTYPEFSYVHIVEDLESWMGKEAHDQRTNDPFREVFRSPVEGKKDSKYGEAFEDPSSENSTIAYIACSDFKADNAVIQSDLKGDIIAIGRPFIAK